MRIGVGKAKTQKVSPMVISPTGAVGECGARMKAKQMEKRHEFLHPCRFEPPVLCLC
jgi:hypothetical protein